MQYIDCISQTDGRDAAKSSANLCETEQGYTKEQTV